jgi:uncharacterized protein (DUF1778 family)
MPVSRKAARTKRFNIRATTHDEKLIRQGAAQRGVNLSNFVLESARLRAEQTLADKRTFELSSRQWQEFLEILDRPPQKKPRLRELLSKPSVLESGQH